jgi:hypothetical protein
MVIPFQLTPRSPQGKRHFGCARPAYRNSTEANEGNKGHGLSLFPPLPSVQIQVGVLCQISMTSADSPGSEMSASQPPASF